MTVHPVVAHTRVNVRRVEQDTARALTDAHSRMLATLLPTLTVLYDRITQERASGAPLTPDWLRRGGTLATVQQAVQDAVTQFAVDAGTAISHASQQAATLATTSAQVQLSSHVQSPHAPEHLVQHVTHVTANATPLLAQLAPDAMHAVTGALTTGLALESPIPIIAQRMQAALVAPLQRMLVIARTLLHTLARHATHATMAVNSDVAAGWLWIADLTGVNPPCIACILMHGTKHPLSEIMQSHVGCRCQMIPYFSDNPDIAGESGLDWFLHQDSETQEMILGETRYKLWREHTVSLEDMMGTQDDGSIYVKPLKELGVKV